MYKEIKVRSYKVQINWNSNHWFGTVKVINSKGQIVASNEFNRPDTFNTYVRIANQCINNKTLNLKAKVDRCQD